MTIETRKLKSMKMGYDVVDSTSISSNMNLMEADLNVMSGVLNHMEVKLDSYSTVGFGISGCIDFQTGQDIDDPYSDVSGYVRSDYLDMDGVLSICVNMINGSGILKSASLACYDENKNYLKEFSLSNTISTPRTMSLDKKIRYIRVSSTRLNNFTGPYFTMSSYYNVDVNQRIDDRLFPLDEERTTFESVKCNRYDINRSDNHYSIHLNGKVERDGSSSYRKVTERLYRKDCSRYIQFKNAIGIKGTYFAYAAYDKNDHLILNKSSDIGLYSAGEQVVESGTFEFTNEVEYVIFNYNGKFEITFYRRQPTSQWVDVVNENTQLVFHKAYTDELSMIQGQSIYKDGFHKDERFAYSEKIYNYGQKVKFENAGYLEGTTFAVAAYNYDELLMQGKSMPPMEEVTQKWKKYDGEYDFNDKDDVQYIRLAICNPLGSPTVRTPIPKQHQLRNVEFYKKGKLNDFYSRDIATLTEGQQNLSATVSEIGKNLSEQIEKEAKDVTNLREEIKSGIINQWKDKKWIAFGTSITNGEFGIYPKYLSSLMCVSSFSNYGVPGGSIAFKEYNGTVVGGHIFNAISSHVSELSSADLITIEGVINDWQGGDAGQRTIGEANETYCRVGKGVGNIDFQLSCLSTVYGALETAVKICQLNSNANVILLTDNSSTEGQSYPSTRKINGHYQDDFNQVVRNVGRFMGVTVIDTAAKSQINEYHPNYLSSSVHHSELGGKQFAYTIWDELKNIHCNNTLSVS